MKRYIYMFLLVYIGFVFQSTIFPHFKLTNIMPNLLVILPTVAGFMFGRKLGMFTGVWCGFLVDCIYGNVIGISMIIFTVIGYLNGMATKLYFKDDMSIPIAALAISDLMYGFMYFICFFLLRGRFSILTYFVDVMIPEMIYTVVLGIVVYKVIQWLDEKIYPPADVPLKKDKDII